MAAQLRLRAHRAIITASSLTHPQSLLSLTSPQAHLLLRHARRSLSTSPPANDTATSSITANDALESELAAKSGEEDIAPERIEPPRKTAYLYFDSCFPIRIGKFDLRYLLAEFSSEDVLDRLKAAIPTVKDLEKQAKEGKTSELEAQSEEGHATIKELVGKYGVKAETVSSRLKDGGAFIRLSYLPSTPTVPLSTPVSSPASPSPSTTPHISGSELQSQPALPPNPTTTAEEGVAEDAAAQLAIERGLQDKLNGRRLGVWYAWGPARVFLVKGKPWLEDLDRFPNLLIRVNFEGPDIGQEELYELFRPFGKIHDITSAPPGDKERYASISYTSVRSAAAARNCLHGYQYRPPASDKTGALTTLRIVYKERVKAHAIRDWISGHPRLIIPIIASLIAGIGYTVFEPIRGWFVKNKVEGTWSIEKYALFSWLRQNTIERLGISRQKSTAAKQTGIEKEREDAAEQLQNRLRDMPDTFITVTGPRGSGKGALISDVLSNQKNVLTIDCGPVIKAAKNDAKLVTALAQEVGYFPQFSFLGSLNNLMDLAAVGVIGQKAGFSNTLDQQLKQVLDTTAVALKSISDSARAHRTENQRARDAIRHSADERARILELARSGSLHDGRIDCVAGNGAISELGAGVERGDGDWAILGPRSASLLKSVQEIANEEKHPSKATDADELPIVVIKSFYSKASDARAETLWNVMADWAAVLVDNGIAHVIFTSDNITVSKPLAKALPNRPFNSVSLNDASSQSALQFVQTKLNEIGRADGVAADNEPNVAVLGGRLTDLESLVQKVASGQTVDEAVEDIIQRSSTELRKNVFGDDAEEAAHLAWSRQQAWYLTKALSKENELRYADVLHNDPFKGAEKALFALEQAEMISIVHHDGRPSTIRAGRPVFRSSFGRLTRDPVFSAVQDLAVNSKSTAGAEGDIKSAETELLELAKLFDGGAWTFGGSKRVPVEIQVRVDGLLGKIREAEEKLVKLKEEEGNLKKVLKEQY